jgi:hypothetical protein
MTWFYMVLGRCEWHLVKIESFLGAVIVVIDKHGTLFWKLFPFAFPFAIKNGLHTHFLTHQRKIFVFLQTVVNSSLPNVDSGRFRSCKAGVVAAAADVEALAIDGTD